MSDSFNIEPLSRLIPAKLVKRKDSSKDRQNHHQKKPKKEPIADIIEEVEEELLVEEDSSEPGKKIPAHFDGFA
jgi:hypothetical protein